MNSKKIVDALKEYLYEDTTVNVHLNQYMRGSDLSDVVISLIKTLIEERNNYKKKATDAILGNTPERD